ncbi:signal peptide peptidase SppA [Halobacteriales archaeon QH_2_65_14]|nr:MAG: signal peptide peptidase SppA [Halobacteriales archaeon QH_2_65_14]
MSGLDAIGRGAVILLGAVVAVAVGTILFGVVPAETTLGTLEVLLVVLVVVLGIVLSGRIAGQVFPGYNVAEVSVDGAITQSGDSPSPLPGGNSAASDDIVEQIEKADADSNAEALILNMNTPGGEVVASEDIRYAAEQFDGPTVAYATNLCASGGMWIASGCDEFHAREGSRVGSIGVNGIKWYDQFIETVAEGRDVDPETARETEARIYLGTEAREIGLVDTLGPRDEMEENLAAELGVDEIRVEEFEPERGLQEKLSVVATRVARGFGRGVASVFVDDGHPNGRV